MYAPKMTLLAELRRKLASNLKALERAIYISMGLGETISVL
jgi:hypothetical protein